MESGAGARRTGGDAPLEERFRAAGEALGLGAGARVLVALSGGADSVALLHLLRFHAPGPGLALHAAHLDHAMRPGSDADARWVAGLCAAWGVPLATERLERAPRSEEEARRARHAFLRRAALDAGDALIATAHHADDQAETVLFRVLRGTGIAGLAGMAPRGDGVLRPLLPFWRDELRAYARAAGLRWREDPTNRTLDPVRNRIRRRLLPLAERSVAPGARRSLVRLAELARAEEAAWSAVLEPLTGEAARREGAALVLARAPFRAYDSAVASRVLRNLLRQFGVVLDRTGTRLALQFITGSPSGRVLHLAGGLRLASEFDSVRVERAGEEPALPDLEVAIPADAPEGEGEARIGGRILRVAWSPASAPAGPAPGGGDAALFPADSLPLVVRGWRPGDRIRTPGGTRTLKKLFAERRVPRSVRHRTPIVADAAGRVLWVVGVERSRGLHPAEGQAAIFLSILDD
ncbi:MAG TPA: tRNA lysidine(34) synthetase TilS [Longimicrobiaceae bacterium]|nr:tRNA lysidine(34) synthetase TilS [Longimicrobiaceae bacterium]